VKAQAVDKRTIHTAQEAEPMNPTLPAEARTPSRRLDPNCAPLLVPAVMAVAMSLVMSLVQTIVRLGFAPNLASAWLTSFAIGVVVTVILFGLHLLYGYRQATPAVGWPTMGRRPDHPVREGPIGAEKRAPIGLEP